MVKCVRLDRSTFSLTEVFSALKANNPDTNFNPLNYEISGYFSNKSYIGFINGGVAHAFKNRKLVPICAYVARSANTTFGSFTEEQTNELFNAFTSVYGPLVSLVEFEFDPKETIEFLEAEKEEGSRIYKEKMELEKLAKEAEEKAAILDSRKNWWSAKAEKDALLADKQNANQMNALMR